MDDWTDDAMHWSPAVQEEPLARYPHFNKAVNRDRWGLVLVIPVAYLAAMVGGAAIWAFWSAVGLLALTAVDSVMAANRDYTERARRRNAQIRRSWPSPQASTSQGSPSSR